MNAFVLDANSPAVNAPSVFDRARRGDLDACASVLDEVATGLYGEAFLALGDSGTAERITHEAVVAVAKPLSRGEIGSLRELRWRMSARVRRDVSAISDRRERLSGVRAGIRHLFGLTAASGLAVYATVLAI